MIPKGEQWEEIAALSRGDLAVTSYAVLLAAMARSGRTGALKLVRRPIEKEIFLVEGRPVECRSNLAHETFGRFLRSEGQLSAEEHHSVLSDSLSREIPLGEALIERGLLSAHEVYRGLQKNLARKLLDGFTWERGSFEFAEDARIEDPAVKTNVLQLILTGVLKLTPEAEITAAMERLPDEPLAIESYPTSASPQLRLSGATLEVIRILEAEPLALEGLKSRVSLPGELVERILYALALLGRAMPVSEIPEGREPEEAELPGEEMPVLPAPEIAAIEPADDQALLLRQASIVEAYLSFQRKDSFDFLGLEEGCTVPEIKQAYLKAAETYAPWSLGAAGGTDFAEQAEILFLKAAQAYTELQNSESRGALIYRRKVLRDEEAARKKPQFSIETDLLDSEEQFKNGLALVERGELGKALELLEFAADCDPQNALYRAELAYRRALFEPLRCRKQSIADLKEAIRIDSECGMAHYYLGLVLADEDDLAGSEEALRRSIKLMAPDRRPIEALKELSGRKKR